MRFAIYYAPQPGTLLHRLGSQWLARDAFEVDDDGHVPGLDGFITDAQRYGFHATLKAPFALHQGKSKDDLLQAVATVSQKLVCFKLASLQLQMNYDFLALMPQEQDENLAELERRCVCDLDQFRAPASEAELAKRRKAGLNGRQEKHLADWGYPYVLDGFRFHMTLTRSLSHEEALELEPQAQAHFAAVLGQPLLIDAITVFREDEPGAPFVVEASFPLQAREERAA